MQVAAWEKENEITVAPTLLVGLELRRKAGMSDEMHTQRRFSGRMVAASEDYL